MAIMTRSEPVRLMAAAVGCVILSACSGSGPSTAGPSTSPRRASASTTTAPANRSLPPGRSPAPGEALVRSLVHGDVDRYGMDRYGWVEATAKDILATYYPPGSHNYLGGHRVEPTDRIYVIKAHGAFDHAAPFGEKSTATLEVMFYNVTTGLQTPFSNEWHGDAPDFGIWYRSGSHEP